MNDRRNEKDEGEKEKEEKQISVLHCILPASKTPDNNLLNGIIARILNQSKLYNVNQRTCIVKILFFAINWLLGEIVKGF